MLVFNKFRQGKTRFKQIKMKLLYVVEVALHSKKWEKFSLKIINFFFYFFTLNTIF